MPSFALASTAQTLAISQLEAAIDLSSPAEPEHLAPRHTKKTKPAQVKRPAGPSLTAANASFAAASPKLSVDAPAASVALATSLHIEISSAIHEGTLAIFADRELLFSTNLQSAAPGEPIRFEHALPAGSHQFRVALYKPNRSLQLEKEGLAEISSEGGNTLSVHVNRRTKLLVRKELALEITWPGSSAPSTTHNSALAAASASLK
jgi:hypothetical protein